MIFNKGINEEFLSNKKDKNLRRDFVDFLAGSNLSRKDLFQEILKRKFTGYEKLFCKLAYFSGGFTYDALPLLTEEIKEYLNKNKISLENNAKRRKKFMEDIMTSKMCFSLRN